MTSTLRPMAVAISLALTIHYAHAEDDDTALQTVTVNSARSTLDRDLPNTSVSKTQEELRQQQNIFNPEDALRNVPSMSIRKRYSGDRNALVGGRSFSTTQAPRALVYMDGYLLSNFLGRFDAPRWNMIAPEEMTRVDVLYGPFSALYPGNAIGTTIAITTSRPTAFSGSLRIAGQDQSFAQYGDKDHYRNYQASALLSDRLASGLWYKLMVNHQDANSQPMGYYAVSANAAGAFPAASGSAPATPVRGIVYDTNAFGQRRALFGANAGALDHTVQNTAKLALGYDISSTISTEALLAWWSNDSKTSNQTFLRDTAGNPVWSGKVTDGTNTFAIPASAFAPYTREERHALLGFSAKTRNKDGWNGSVNISAYRILDDQQRNASVADPLAANGGAGSAVIRDGSGFQSMDASISRADDTHALTFGVHADSYQLKQTTRATADWRSASGAESQYVGGETRILAIYGQDAWHFAPQWHAVFGLRAESWQASDGVQRVTPGATVNYARRSEQAWSPKLSLAWDADADADADAETTLRASYGRGTRFGTVAELFQGTAAGSSITINDPNLKPERSNALELSAERRYALGNLRASLFQDDVRNTIWSQLNLNVFPVVTNVQNVGRVRTRGLELVGQIDRLGIHGLSAGANLAFSKSTILENDNYLPSVGKNWSRVPRVRSATTLVYAPADTWSLAATYRYSGPQFNEINNSDYNTDVYGGVSRVRQLDVRLLLKPVKGTELALGVDNLNNNKAYQLHPYPGRTLFAEARYAF